MMCKNMDRRSTFKDANLSFFFLLTKSRSEYSAFQNSGDIDRLINECFMLS